MTNVLIEPDTGVGPWPAARKRGLAHFQRITPQVVAIQLDRVESVEEGITVMASVADTVERGNAVIVTYNRLPIDDAGARAQASQRLDDQREAASEVIAGPGCRASPAHHPFGRRFGIHCASHAATGRRTARRAELHALGDLSNRWLPQTTNEGCVESSGDLPPPSPPAVKAAAC